MVAARSDGFSYNPLPIRRSGLIDPLRILKHRYDTSIIVLPACGTQDTKLLTLVTTPADDLLVGVILCAIADDGAAVLGPERQLHELDVVRRRHLRQAVERYGEVTIATRLQPV